MFPGETKGKSKPGSATVMLNMVGYRHMWLRGEQRWSQMQDACGRAELETALFLMAQKIQNTDDDATKIREKQRA